VNEMHTTREVAALLRCTPRKVTKTATEKGIGSNLGGSAGFRFTEADVEQLRESMRPVVEVVEAAS
jgi:hypothetical protein